MKTKVIYFMFFCIPLFIFGQYENKKMSNPFANNLSHKKIDLKGFYDATKSLPSDHVKDGSVDYTKYLQTALNKYNNVLMPNFTVSTSGLLAISNSHIKFQSNSKLKLIPTDRERYQVLAIHGVENVTVTNAKIEGDLKNHKGTKGEWGFGIDIRNSQNITINNAKVSNCWGDGIVVAYGTKGFLGKETFKTANIVISDFNISYCRRNGITVGGVNKLTINNGIISNIKGTAPQAGIMIEPDKTKYILKDISITNVSTSNCVTGIATNLGNYVSEIESKSFDLLIENFTSKDNKYGVYFAGFKTLDKKKAMKGNVKIRNVKTINTKKPFEHRDKYALFPTINISNFSVDNKKISNFTPLLKTSYKENVYFKN